MIADRAFERITRLRAAMWESVQQHSPGLNLRPSAAEKYGRGMRERTSPNLRRASIARMRVKGKSSFLKADEILFQRATSLVILMTRISGSSSISASWLWFYILCRTISVADTHI